MSFYAMKIVVLQFRVPHKSINIKYKYKIIFKQKSCYFEGCIYASLIRPDNNPMINVIVRH